MPARHSLLAVAAIVLAPGGVTDSPASPSNGEQIGTFALREFGDEASLPVTVNDDGQNRLDLIGGSLTLQKDHSFNLQLDFNATKDGQTVRAPWRTSGFWSMPEPDHLELHSAAFGDYDPARGLFIAVEQGSSIDLRGNLHPGPAIVLPLGFTYVDGITYGPDPYTFQ